MSSLLRPLTQFLFHLLSTLDRTFRHLTQPTRHSLLLDTAPDLARSKAELVAENALLRQQLIVLRRQVKKPTFYPKRSPVAGPPRQPRPALEGRSPDPPT